MMGIEDLKHFVQIAPFAFAGDLLKLPVAKRVVLQHALALAPRVTFTDDAREKYQARRDKTKGLVKVFIEMARSVQAVFAIEQKAGSPDANRSYVEELAEVILDGLRALQANWPGEFCTINVVNARHFAESVDIHGFPAGLSTCMLELMHTLDKSKVSTTSGSLTVVKHENFRQAARYLLQVLQHPEVALRDPAISGLPEGIRQDLLNPDNNALRALLRPRPTKSPYVPVDKVGSEVVSFVRPGPPFIEMLTLTSFEVLLLRRLCCRVSRTPTQVERLKSLVLPDRSACVGTLSADRAGPKGYAHYAADAAVGDGKHAGIVQLEDLF